MEDINALKARPDGEEINLSLPIRKKDLGEFISGLLGQQQSIEHVIDASFDIDHTWIVNLHETIHQRIVQQSHAHLTDFNAVVYFQNGLKRTLTSVEALKSYSETKKQLPLSIKLLWIYLVHFPSKGYPEKQQITFSAQSRWKLAQNKKVTKSNAESVILDLVTGDSERSLISYQIDHTERTWGDDIDTIISSHVEGIIRGNQIKDTLFSLSRLMLALTMLMFSITYPAYDIYSSSYTKDKLINNAISNYEALNHSNVNSLESISIKLDALAGLIEITGKQNATAFALILLILGPPLTLVFLRLTRKTTYSFLNISKESETYRDMRLKQEKRSTWILIGSFCLSILAGIFKNLVTTWIMK